MPPLPATERHSGGGLAVSTETEFKQALKEWVTSGKVRAEELGDETPIIEQRIITSLQTLDLILFLEHLTGNAIYESFGQGDSHAG